ncbi:MAG TPA: adenylate/guanylate cyclase domain-containing protein [Mycobacteriales bacterium]|nr:adenylate/guanylate cyclase domain-containing protein [Mycobacteriales bacterium]
MDWRPDINYARSRDGTNLAYAVVSEGRPDILWATGMATNLGLDWTEIPGVDTWQERLTGMGRLVMYDQRGAGRSDPIALNDLPTVEQQAEDMAAVLDAAGVDREAVVFATTSLGPAAMLLAATEPQRVSSLILYGTYARMIEAPDYPAGVPEELLARFAGFSSRAWGTGAMLRIIAPSVAFDADYVAMQNRMEKLSISPAQSEMLSRLGISLDVRHVLGAISVPTLVLHRRGDQFVSIEHARFLADHIPSAKLVEVEGEDHAFNIGDTESLLGPIEEFVTGRRTGSLPRRVLATVVFTDIVDSTRHAAELGDGNWRQLLDRHDRAVQRQIERFQGRLVNTTGDGSVASFDSPARAVLAAAAIRDAVKILELDIRAGIHTGEVEIRGSDIGGIAVHIASRIQGLAKPGEILVSRTVTDLVVGSGIEFRDTGEHDLKGVPGTWRVFATV